MAVTPFQLPMIQQSVPVVDPQTGLMTGYFADWLNRVLTQITDQVNIIDANLAAVQAAQAQIIAVQAQLVAVQQAQNPASGKFGSASLLGGAIGSAWTHGPLVNLTGVAAGNLTFPGSGPTQNDSTDVNPGGSQATFTGHWRIQEVIGAGETTVFTGDYVAQRLRDDGASPFVSVLYNTSNTGVSIPLATTGAIGYRLDLQAHDATLGDFEVDACPLALYVNRA